MEDPFIYDEPHGSFRADEHGMVIKRDPCAAWSLYVNKRRVMSSFSQSKVRDHALSLIAGQESKAQ